MDRPDTHFAWNGDVSLAYQVCGDGPTDLVYLQGYCSNVDVNWESPSLSRFLRGLASHARLIVTDRRGWGCSERFTPGYVPDVDTLTDDVLAVLKAARSERASIMATYESTIVASLFAATYPERTRSLILIDPQVTYLPTEETPWMPSPARWQEQIQAVRDTWGTLGLVGRPRRAGARVVRPLRPGLGHARWAGRRAYQLPAHGHPRRAPHDPGPDARARRQRSFLRGAPDTGHFVARKIPGARVVEHSSRGGPHFHWYARGEAIVAEVRRFLAEIGEEEASFDRILATILFTDIVESTRHAAELGDRRWRDMVLRHHATVRGLLARYRGIEIDTAGDGFFASFDGPARAVRCAMAITDAIRPLGIEVRAGLHTGEVDRVGDKIGGLAVNIGARVAALALPSEVLVSQTVRDLMVGSGLTFADRGSHELKGVPGVWGLYAARKEAGGPDSLTPPA